jgi:diamine N-acetyltransferase
VDDPGMDVALREITAADRAAVEALAVAPEQERFVDGVAASLAEAAEHPDAKPWYRAVYAGDTPVGFVMLSDGITVDNPAYLGPYFLWRLLIDRRHQGRGHGAAALALAVAHVRTRPDAEVLLTSCGLGEGSPLGFYLRHGFHDTGRHDGPERILELPLRP